MDKLNLSFEPMDVDLSIHSNLSNNDMDVSHECKDDGIDAFIRKINDSVHSTPVSARDALETSSIGLSSIPSKTNIKKFHINMPIEKVSHHTATKIKLICAALILLVSMIAFQIWNIQCCDDINPVTLKQKLSDKLYGQTKAIDALIDGLAINRSKILIIYGSTGVGKTFAASILLEHLGSHSNVYHYTMPSFMETFTTDFMLGLTVCKNTIIIVDDLSPSDQNVKVHINNLISKSESLNKEVTVLLIYNNCNTAKDFIRQCDETFPAKIIDSLKLVNAFKKMIRFELLTEEHLQKCIKTELGFRRIGDEQLKKLLKNFDVTIDGCKGVHTKIKLLDL